VAIDEFLAGYLTAGGRTAFYRAAKGIALERPESVWERMPELRRPLLFVWGTRDQLVPASFREHVERALPSAAQLTLDCGHLPQLERPRELHAALRSFLAG
jgi:pimeloyl-ACP methyl ester carboxylesterase